MDFCALTRQCIHASVRVWACVCTLAYVSVSVCSEEAKEAIIKCFQTAHDPIRMTKTEGNVKTKTAHAQLGW